MTCQFEWASHEAEARKAGLSDQSIETVRLGGSTFDAADEQLIHDYAVGLLDKQAVSNMLYRKVQEMFGTPDVAKLTALIGCYAIVALTLNAHEFGVPKNGVPPLPPPRHTTPRMRSPGWDQSSLRWKAPPSRRSGGRQRQPLTATWTPPHEAR